MDDALDLFARELTALRARAGNPPYKQIVHQARRQQPSVAMNTSTLSDWFHGRSAPNAGPPIRFLLEYLRARAAGQYDVPPVSWYVATLLASDNQPEGLAAASQGNAQTTANGDLFVGWGSLPYFSEFSSSGALLLNAQFPTGVNTYRAYRLPWPSH